MPRRSYTDTAIIILMMKPKSSNILLMFVTGEVLMCCLDADGSANPAVGEQEDSRVHR